MEVCDSNGREDRRFLHGRVPTSRTAEDAKSTQKDSKVMFKELRFLTAPAALSVLLAMSPVARADSDDPLKFKMVVSAGAKACVPNATASVSILPLGPVELMDVAVQGLPPKTEFD